MQPPLKDSGLPHDIQNLSARDRILQAGNITVTDFLHQLNDIEVGRYFILPAYPSIEEAKALSSASNEVFVARSKSGRTYVLKGDEGKVRILKEELVLIDPDIIAHTHPRREISDEQRRLFTDSLSSSGDLSSRSAGVDIEYVYNEFGRITFIPIRNLGSLPVEKQKDGAETITQQIINNVMGAAVKDAKEKGVGVDNIQALLNHIGDYLKVIGCKFVFERWDQVKNLTEPPEGF